MLLIVAAEYECRNILSGSLQRKAFNLIGRSLIIPQDNYTQHNKGRQQGEKLEGFRQARSLTRS